MRKDITNQVFGSLTAFNYLGIFPVGNQGKTRGKWLCTCNCNKQVEVFTGDLISGKNKSCGCLGNLNSKGEKKCSVCKNFFDIKNFYNKDFACKTCSNLRNRTYTTKEENNKNQRDSYIKHKKKRLEYSKKYREANKDIITSNLKAWRKANPNYKKERWKNDLDFKLKENLRGRFYKAIVGYTKSNSINTLIGCSINELKDYLSLKFTDGMTWDNHGAWHIDHIKPCSLFDFSKEEDQKLCFHFTNLQPLWALDNLKKSNKYE